MNVSNGMYIGSHYILCSFSYTFFLAALVVVIVVVVVVAAAAAAVITVVAAALVFHEFSHRNLQMLTVYMNFLLFCSFKDGIIIIPKRLLLINFRF